MPDAITADVASIPSLGASFNPIAWGQFHLRGGWRSFWPTTLGYIAVVGAGILLVVRLTAGVPGALGGMKTAFMGLQAGLLVLFVSSRVSTAIRQDLTSRMIESHRLMPMSPSQAVLGYLFGPSAQPLAICAANVLLGCGLSKAIGTPVTLWLTANGILFVFALFMLALAGFGAFTGRPGGVAIGWIGMFIGLINFVTIGAILPGVNVLATPLMGRTVFDLGVVGGDAVVAYAPSTVFQAWIAAVCFASACRRYRRDDRPALGWDLGLLLLAAWVATSAFGIMFWEQFQPSAMRGRPVNPVYQLIGSALAAMLLALVPLAGAAWSSADWSARRAMGDPSSRRRPPAPVLVALAAAAVTLLLCAAPLRAAAVEAPARALGCTAAILASFYVATTYVLRILVRVTDKLLYPLLVWLMLAWIVPMAVDYVGWWMRGDYADAMLGRASSFGALGALIQAWAGDPAVAVPGVVFQLLLAMTTAALYYASRSRIRRAPTPPAVKN